MRPGLIKERKCCCCACSSWLRSCKGLPAAPGFYLDFQDLCLSWVSPWSRVTWHMLFWAIMQRLMTMYSRSCTDKDMGNFGGCFWLVAWWGAWEVLGLMGKESSGLRFSKLSQGWNIVNKDLFLPALIVGSYSKALWIGFSLLGKSFKAKPVWPFYRRSRWSEGEGKAKVERTGVLCPLSRMMQWVKGFVLNSVTYLRAGHQCI